MLECRHRMSCNPNCWMYITKEGFHKEQKTHCVLQVIWTKLEEIEDHDYDYASSNHDHDYEYAGRSHEHKEKFIAPGGIKPKQFP
ncbi:MAG: hypothetical protein KGZ75_13735 [Syntrophomonadaceae bacterium]|nr:hypothetical protein [Syntrophomonadaceae bacterium]